MLDKMFNEGMSDGEIKRILKSEDNFKEHDESGIQNYD